jgi:hypothetical protein
MAPQPRRAADPLVQAREMQAEGTRQAAKAAAFATWNYQQGAPFTAYVTALETADNAFITAVNPGGLVPSAHAVAAEIPALREIGLSDAVIEELLRDNHTATPEEIALVQRARAVCHSNPEWVRRYLAGDAECRRIATLMAIVAVQAGVVTP